MANKRLSLQDVEELKKMVQTGVAPEDIANHFGMAISSVHNYKKKFKADGMVIPSMRGKRPVGSVDGIAPVNQSSRPLIGQMGTPTMQGDNYKFIVNGVSVQISGQAKNVNIGKDHMEINF